MPELLSDLADARDDHRFVELALAFGFLKRSHSLAKVANLGDYINEIADLAEQLFEHDFD